MCRNRYSNPGVARAGATMYMSLSLIKWKSSSRKKKFKKKQQQQQNQVYFLITTAIFQARTLDRHFHHQCSHLDKGLVFSGAVCQESQSWQQETAGALDPWAAATCTDGTGNTFRCARCRWEKLRLWLTLRDPRDVFSSQHRPSLPCMLQSFSYSPPCLLSLCMQLPLLVPCPELFHCCLGPVITENNYHNLRNQNFKHKWISIDALVSFLLSLCVQLPQCCHQF